MDKFDWLLLFVVLMLIAVAVFVMFGISNDARRCINNPIQYGLSFYSRLSPDAFCTCSVPGSNPLFITYNSTSQKLPS